MKIGLFFQEITFITEFPGSNFLLPTFLTGGKSDFQVANLLLSSVNFELCIYLFYQLTGLFLFDKVEEGESKIFLKLAWFVQIL